MEDIEHHLQRHQALMRAEDVASAIGVSRNTLAKWRSEGNGPPYVKLGTGKSAAVRYRQWEVFEYASKVKSETNARSDRHSYLYVISQDDSHHKVGKAIDVEKRLRGLQVGNPNRLRITATLKCSTESCAFFVENLVQWELRKHRSNAANEWFQCSALSVTRAINKVLRRVDENLFIDNGLVMHSEEQASGR